MTKFEDKTIHIPEDEPFVIVMRVPAQDNNVSAEALAAMVYLLSKPSGWIVRVKDIMNRFGWGRDKTKKTLKELRELGYLATEMKRNEEGKFVGKIDRLSRLPKSETTEGESVVLKTRPTDNPLYGKSGPLNNKEGLENKEEYIGADAQKQTTDVSENTTPDDNHDDIVNHVNESSDGIHIDALSKAFPDTPQLWDVLVQLEKDKRIDLDGPSRTAYKSGTKPDAVVDFDDLPRPDWEYKPVHSTKADHIADAIMHAFGYKEMRMTKNERSRLRKVAKDLSEVDVYADEIPDFYAWLQKTYNTFHETAMTTNVTKWRNSKATPSRWQPALIDDDDMDEDVTPLPDVAAIIAEGRRQLQEAMKA